MERDGVVPAPEHHPLTGPFVDKDHRELVGPVMDDSIGDVNAPGDECLLDARAVVVGADHSGKLRFEAERGASRERRCHLAATGHSVARDSDLRIRAVGFGTSRQTIDVVDGSSADTYDVPGPNHAGSSIS